MGRILSKNKIKPLFIGFGNQAIEYAKVNNIAYKVIEPNKKKFIIKSYADNFTNN